MGKFDGYLVCSDLDGTFTASGVSIEENIRAVQYFTANGGRFSFATGRMADHLRDLGLLSLTNAPACLCNGSIVYDPTADRVLRYRSVPFSVEAFLDAIQGTAHLVKGLDLFLGEHGTLVRYTSLTEVSAQNLAEHPAKLLCRFETPEDANAFKQHVLQLPFFRNTYIAKSWAIGVEFNAAEATKGQALRFIKEYLGNIHTSVGIGDYENDLTLVQCADIGAAVGNALDCVKEAADIVVKPCKEMAVKDLIETLERRL